MRGEDYRVYNIFPSMGGATKNTKGGQVVYPFSDQVQKLKNRRVRVMVWESEVPH